MGEADPMTPMLSSAVRQALESSSRLSNKIAALYPEDFKVDVREDYTVRYLSLAQDHREAILLLLSAGARSSAYALARCVYEACMRGLWMQFAATDQQILNFAKTGILPGFDRIVRQLSAAQAAPAYSTLKQQAWEGLSDFAHGGQRQISRWSSPHGIEPVHPDSEVVHLLHMLDGWAVLACIGICSAAKAPMAPLMSLLPDVHRRLIEAQHAATKRDVPAGD